MTEEEAKAYGRTLAGATFAKLRVARYSYKAALKHVEATTGLPRPARKGAYSGSARLDYAIRGTYRSGIPARIKGLFEYRARPVGPEP